MGTKMTSNGKVKMRPLVVIMALLSSLSPLCLAAGSTNGEYRLVWSDEFGKDGKPDPKKWTFEEGFVRNEELQWYQPENAFCKDGLLIIEGRRERRPNPLYKKGGQSWKEKRGYIDYTAACLITRGLHSWMYGRFEVKARIKTRSGLWPAVWFLGVSGNWPFNGEVDLMEYYNSTILANACWGSGKQGEVKWNASKKPLKSFNDPKWDETFHVWRMDWDSQRINLYLDEVLLNSIDLTKTANPPGRGPANPFRQPHYMLLNLAIGGNSGGDPSGTPFPTRFEVDYVRVSQKE